MPTPSSTDTPSYDIEYRSTVDDAWYSAAILINTATTTLVVKLFEFPDSSDEIFSVDDHTTVSDVDEFMSRFRPVSEQLQDTECGSVKKGDRVCASFTFDVGDVRYYDAIVDSVIPKKHLVGKEEECKCKFLLYWLHGSNEGNVTDGCIANICMIQPFAKTDSRLASFSKMAKEKIGRCAFSDIVSVGSGSSLSIQEKKEDKQCPSPPERTKESTRIRKLHDDDYQDIDFPGGITKFCENNVHLKDTEGLLGRKRCSSLSSLPEAASRNDLQVMGDERVSKSFRRPAAKDGGLSCAEKTNSHHFIIVGNLEKDLSSSSVVKFIRKHTSISPQVFIFPSLSSELFTKGVIEIDSEEKFKDLCKFLQNPDNIITSSKGRPWLVHNETLSCEAFGTTLHGATSKLQEKTSVEELKIVHRSAPDYRVSKRMRDTYELFTDHQKRLHKRLAWEENEIIKMIDDASDDGLQTDASDYVLSKLEKLKELGKTYVKSVNSGS